jgi:hypothetical protein
MKPFPTLLLLFAALCSIPPAYAAIPALPEIPLTLPDAIREPLIAKRATLALKRVGLIADGEANTRQCTNIKKDSAQHQECLSKLSEFNAKVESLRGERDRLEDEIDAAIAANTDPMVVDARVAPMGANLLAQVPMLERSPAADRIRKGFQTLMTVPRDWPVVLAWWQEALQHDPNNAALIRSVDLAQWMVDSKKRAASRQSTSTSYPVIDALMRGDATEVTPLIEQANKRNAIQDAEAKRMTNIINNQIKQRAAAPTLPKLSPKSASLAQMATAGDRALSEQMFEDGLQFLLMGDYKHAEEMFQRADFQRNFDAGKP